MSKIDLKAMDQLSVRMATVPYAHIHDKVLDEMIKGLREARAALEATIGSMSDANARKVLASLDERFNFGSEDSK